MRSFRIHRPSPSLAVSLVALLAALGGTSYAAFTLPKNSVGTKQLKNNAVVSSKVKNHSLTMADFKPGQLPAGPRGATGPTGPAGAMGPAGPTASAFAIENKASSPEAIPANAFGVNLDLNQGGTHTGPITVSFQARLVVNGQAVIQNTGGAAQSAECRLGLVGSGSPPFNEAADVTVPAAGYETATQTGAFDVSPGTYNFQLQCAEFPSGTSTLQYDKGDLTVVAVAR
jgi:hypothetical protein